jgi:glutaredoxin
MGGGSPDIIAPMATDAALLVYTRPDCTYSDALLHDLDNDGVEYKQIDLEMHPELVPELERLTGGERVTPVMVEGDLVIVGYHGIG